MHLCARLPLASLRVNAVCVCLFRLNSPSARRRASDILIGFAQKRSELKALMEAIQQIGQ
jgi:hypothetical protein